MGGTLEPERKKDNIKDVNVQVPGKPLALPSKNDSKELIDGTIEGAISNPPRPDRTEETTRLKMNEEKVVVAEDVRGANISKLIRMEN